MPARRIGLLALSLLICGAALACRTGGASDEEIPLPDTTPFSPEQATSIHEIRDAVMELRGLSVSAEIGEGTLTRDEIRAYYDLLNDEVDEEDREELATFNTALRMLRIIGPEDDLLTLFTDFWGDASAGFYSIEDDELVLIGDGSNLSYDDRSTLAHEYVHSFQDAAFDLDRFDELAEKEDENEDGAPTEYGTTTSCVLEGDAEISQYMFEANVLGPEPEDPEVGEPPAAGLESEIPPGFLRYMGFNYNECAIWALSLYIHDQGGWDTLNKAYADPPWTTEQIMHPEKYLDRESVTGMPPLDLTDRLGDGWERLDSAIFGEFDVYNYLTTVLEDDTIAAQAAAGWGVGWLGIYSFKGEEGTTDDRSVVHVALEFDSDSDFQEFVAAYNGVIAKLGGPAGQISDNAAVCWTGALEHAHVAANSSRRRVDILMTTDDESLKAASSGPLSSGAHVACAGA
jgi:hypothetical protein